MRIYLTDIEANFLWLALDILELDYSSGDPGSCATWDSGQDKIVLEKLRAKIVRAHNTKQRS